MGSSGNVPERFSLADFQHAVLSATGQVETLDAISATVLVNGLVINERTLRVALLRVAELHDAFRTRLAAPSGELGYVVESGPGSLDRVVVAATTCAAGRPPLRWPPVRSSASSGRW